MGRRVAFCDGGGDRFATAVVEDRGYNDLAYIARTGVEGHQGYDSPAEFVSQMRDYYPDRRVTVDTLASVVHWDHGGLWE